MPNAGHQEFADLANEMLAEEGFETTLVKPGAAGGSKRNPTPADDTEQTVRVAYSKLKVQEVDGQRVLATDTKLLIAPQDTAGADVAVSTDYLIRLGGAARKIEHFERIAPGDLTCLWVIYTR